MTIEEYNKKYPPVDTANLNWNTLKSVPGKPDRDVQKEFGFCDNKACIPEVGLVDLCFNRKCRLGNPIIGDTNKSTIEQKNEYQTWQSSIHVEKSTGQDFVVTTEE